MLREKKLTVKQAMETLGLGRTTIYSWIKEGKLRYETTPRGKIILLSEEEEQKIIEMTQLYSGEVSSGSFDSFYCNFGGSETVHEGTVVNSDPILNSPPFSSVVHQKEDEVILEMLKTINNLNEKLLSYSEKAGQIKLLSDSESRTKEEYFIIIQENAALKERLNIIEAEKDDMKEKINKIEEEKAVLNQKIEKKRSLFSFIKR